MPSHSSKKTRRSNTSSNAGIKLKDYLKERYPDLTSRVLKRALEQGACKVNGKIERFATRRIDPRKDKIQYSDIRPESIEKLVIDPDRIVLEDEHLIIYDKPAGHATLATEGVDKVHLHGELEKFLRLPLKPVHRLDKNTSGLIMFAKTQDASSKLGEMFQEKEITKTYEAIVDGVLEGKGGRIVSYMRLEKQGRGWQRWESISETVARRLFKEYLERKRSNNESDDINFEGFLLRKKFKTAITNYEVLATDTKKHFSHLRFMPETGRTHQLRLHSKSIGHPILGDNFYTDNFSSKIMPARHLLHARRLVFKHPYTGAVVKVEAGLPGDMRELIKT